MSLAPSKLPSSSATSNATRSGVSGYDYLPTYMDAMTLSAHSHAPRCPLLVVAAHYAAQWAIRRL